MDSNQLAWLSGYLYRLSESKVEFPPAPWEPNSSSKNLTIVYGSQTGNCQSVAEKFFEAAKERGHRSRLFNVEEFSVSQLAETERLLLLISTHGNGEPPDSAIEFYEDLMDPDFEGDFSSLEFAILAFGDRTYEHFCKTGHDLDKRLRELKAKAWIPILECDVDYKPTAESWRQTVFGKLKEEGAESPEDYQPLQIESPKTDYRRENPFPAKLRKNTLICDIGADKEVRHLEFSIKDSGITYEPGDALGVFPLNPEENVQRFLKHFKANPSDEVSFEGRSLPLQTVLSEKVDIQKPTRNLILRLREKNRLDLPAGVSSDETKLKDYLARHSTLDILEQTKPSPQVSDIIPLLPEIAPRLYSISSSPGTHSGEIHLTVKKEVYRQNGKEKQGLCSGFLNDLAPKREARIYVHPNRAFRLPEDGKTPVIMIGAGTGIAPYRAFLHDMENRGYQGESWLFFGEQKFFSTFFYQAEIRKFLKKGILNRFNGAFSRDGAQKVYVQDKIRENAKDFFDWIRRGAVIYLCGDAKRMAVDVEKAILQIFQEEGGKKTQEAKDYLKKLSKNKKFQKDVY